MLMVWMQMLRELLTCVVAAFFYAVDAVASFKVVASVCAMDANVACVVD